jgi:hypothetical protein
VSESYQISGRQIAAGRALLGLDQVTLAAQARISIATLRRMEASGETVSGHVNNVDAVRRALEAAGVEFTNGDQPGVRLRKQASSEDLPSLRTYSASRLTSERATVVEWAGAADDDQSAIEKLAAHLKRQMDSQPGYMRSDAVTLTAPDRSIVKIGTVDDFLAAHA